MALIDPKIHAAVLKLNRLTRDGVLKWSPSRDAHGSATFGLGGSVVGDQFEVIYHGKVFTITGSRESMDQFPNFALTVAPKAKLEVRDLLGSPVYTFPAMSVIGDLFTTVKQAWENTNVEQLMDDILRDD